MSETPHNQQERLFETLLDESVRFHIPPLPQARRAAETDTDVAADLALIAALQQITPGRHEREGARARVGERIAALMATESSPAVSEAKKGARAFLRAVTAPPVLAARKAAARQRLLNTLRRASVFAAALFVAVAATLAWASVASAHALPESPLYSIKRAEEEILWAFAWTDESKGQTLTVMAGHRLNEASAEAGQKHTTEALHLVGNLNTTLGRLVTLTAHAQRTHEDTSPLTSDIRSMLDAEQTGATQAVTHGETDFARALSDSMLTVNTQITTAGVTLPKSPHQGDDGQNNGAGQGKPQQTPTPKPTHTPRTDSGSGSPQTKPTPIGTPVITPTSSASTPSAMTNPTRPASAATKTKGSASGTSGG